MTKIKILIDELNSGLDTAQEKIGQLEDRSVENSQTEEPREKKDGKHKNHVNNLLVSF